jgi:hypothetical protein
LLLDFGFGSEIATHIHTHTHTHMHTLGRGDDGGSLINDVSQNVDCLSLVDLSLILGNEVGVVADGPSVLDELADLI